MKRTLAGASGLYWHRPLVGGDTAAAMCFFSSILKGQLMWEAKQGGATTVMAQAIATSAGTSKKTK